MEDVAQSQSLAAIIPSITTHQVLAEEVPTLVTGSTRPNINLHNVPEAGLVSPPGLWN
jgi:hypothetical protein